MEQPAPKQARRPRRPSGSVPTKYGPQPARQLIAEAGLTITEAARRTGENRNHLDKAVRGLVIPCDRLRESLPRVLGRPLEELFTENVLALRYGGGYGTVTSVPRPVTPRETKQ